MRYEMNTTGFARMLMLGAALTLTACGGKDANDDAAGTGDSAVAGSATMGGDTSATGGAMGSTTGAAGADASAMNDANILSMIGMSNGGEIGTSKAVQGKAKDASVKSFAADMIKEHTAMQGEADKLATKINVTPQPPSQADMMKKSVDSATTALNSASGADLDRQYMAFQVQAHQMTLDNLQRFETQAQNAELKALIQKAIPKVQAHLQRAQEINGKLGGAA